MFAIAITLLILEIPVQHPAKDAGDKSLLSAILELSTSLLAFLLTSS